MSAEHLFSTPEGVLTANEALTRLLDRVAKLERNNSALAADLIRKAERLSDLEAGAKIVEGSCKALSARVAHIEQATRPIPRITAINLPSQQLILQPGEGQMLLTILSENRHNL
jgi:hypothetical protein